MTTLFKWSVPLLVCLMIALSGTAQTVAIISSQEFNSNHKMDETWKSIATAAGLSNDIFPSSFLSNNNLRSQTDLIIISSGTGTITVDQRSNILQYVKAGGHIYIQSEYLDTFDGNELFQYLLEKTGSAFAWGAQRDNNIGPLNIINGFSNGVTNAQLDYFWYGTYGCGDAQVIPFLEVDGKNYAFYYRSIDPNIGNIMTNVDHDWIRTIANNQAPREALMSNMMDVLLNGLSHADIHLQPSVTLPANINFCTSETITAQVQNANATDIQWFINGQASVIGADLTISNLSNGDSLYAQATFPTGCLETTITSETIVVRNSQFTPAFSTTFDDLEPICPGTMTTVALTYDNSLPNIRHNWFLNGKDTPVSTDYYNADDFNDGDILEHGLTYFNGCEDIYLPTSGSFIISWNNTTASAPQINGQATFCTPSIATLRLSSANIENAEIDWYINNVPTGTNEATFSIDATEETKEVYATIRYYSNCSGWVTESTTAVKVGIDSLEIILEEKADHDCTNGEGFIEIYSNTTNAHYTWSNGQAGNYISNLSEGTYTVTATSDAGCTATTSYDIAKIIFPLVASVDVNQPNCNAGYGQVQLDLSHNNLDDIHVQWTNDQGQVVSTDRQSAQLPAGDYTIHVDVNGNCSEIHNITIDGYYEDHTMIVDTMFVERGDTLVLIPATSGYEGYDIEWKAHPSLSCTNCTNPELTATVSNLYNYTLISDAGCRIEKAVLLLVHVRDPYYAPSAFSPNNDGINDYYKIMPRSDVFPTSSLQIFDRWGSLIHEEDSDSHGWDGKSFGKKIQKGIYVFVQNFEDTMGNTYLAKGSITIFN